MSAVMEAGTQPVTRGEDGTPSDLLKVIDDYLEGHVGLPTREIVAAICADPAAVFRASQVLRYFIIQSPLRPRDFGTLCMTNDSTHASHVIRAATNDRDRLIASSNGRWKPRWEG